MKKNVFFLFFLHMTFPLWAFEPIGEDTLSQWATTPPGWDASGDVTWWDGIAENRTSDTNSFDTRWMARLSGRAFLPPLVDNRLSLGVRYDFDWKRSIQTQDLSDQKVTEFTMDHSLGLGGRWTTPIGFEILGGLWWVKEPAHTSTSTGGASASIATGDSSLWIPWLGVQRRMGGWNLSVFFSLEGSSSRTVTATTDLGGVTQTSSRSMTFYTPPMAMGHLDLNLSAGVLGFEGAMLFASKNPDKASGSSTSVQKDWYYTRLDWEQSLGTWWMKPSFTYKTARYQNLGLVNLDSLPAYEGRFTAGTQVWGPDLFGTFHVGYGSDTQNLDQFKTDYSVLTLGLSAGIRAKL